MRILHVVAYISADGAFGGPVAVAVAHCVELAGRGHHVELWAGWDGRARVEAPGVELRLFRLERRPGQRLASLLSPALAFELRRRRRDVDVVHVHFGRDLVSLSSWIALHPVRRRLVLQTHGMVMPDRRPATRLLDLLLVRRALREASKVLTLTSREEEGLAVVARAPIAVHRIANGVRTERVRDFGRPDGSVLFLARLHPRKQVMRFAEAARHVLAAGVDAHFDVVGPDEGDLEDLLRYIRSEGLEDRLRYLGAAAPADAIAHLRAARLYVLPSDGEVFPMTVVEALAVGTPVVTTVDNGLAVPLHEAGAALTAQSDAEAIASAISDALSDEHEREVLARRGYDYARSHLSIESVVDELLPLYELAASRPARRHGLEI